VPPVGLWVDRSVPGCSPGRSLLQRRARGLRARLLVGVHVVAPPDARWAVVITRRCLVVVHHRLGQANTPPCAGTFQGRSKGKFAVLTAPSVAAHNPPASPCPQPAVRRRSHCDGGASSEGRASAGPHQPSAAHSSRRWSPISPPAARPGCRARPPLTALDLPPRPFTTVRPVRMPLGWADVLRRPQPRSVAELSRPGSRTFPSWPMRALR
jgi:hypothetical protein